MQKILCRCCGKYKDVSEFNDIQHFSVDFDFCIKAKNAGFKIFVDPNAKMGHLGDAEVVTQDTFLKNVKRDDKKED